MASLGLNADVGEGFGVWRLGDDEAMLDLITSANVACGFMPATRGAGRLRPPPHRRQPRGPDRRRYLPDRSWQAFARTAGSTVSYVKRHGALYNTIVTDRAQACAVAQAVRAVDPSLPVCWGFPSGRSSTKPPTSVCVASPRRSPTAPTGRMVRGCRAAVLGDPDEIAERVAMMVRCGQIVAVDGSAILIAVESVCVRGDSPGAIRIATAVRQRLSADAIELKPFI